MTFKDAFKNSKTVIIVGHTRPDGDCIGAGLALRRALLVWGIDSDFVCDSRIPYTYSFMPDYEHFNNPRYSGYDTLICVDCADKSRMGKYQSYLKLRTINIDHHFTNDGFGNINYIRSDFSSACEIVCDLLSESGLLDPTTATLLYTGLSADTGNFLHNNVNEHSFSAAMALLKAGADIRLAVRGLYQSYTKARMNLIGKCILDMKFYLDSRVALIYISLNDLEKRGCGIADTESIIDHASSVKDVEVSVCICEQAQNSYRVSLRSKAADVSQVASHFGGGGHKYAAGCVINGYYEDILQGLIKQISTALSE